MHWSWKIIFLVVGVGLISGSVGYYLAKFQDNESIPFVTPFIDQEKAKPLLAYTLPNLAKREYQTSAITVEKFMADHPTYTSYLFSYQTLGKKMTGQLNVPKTLVNPDQAPVVVMLRGYVPLEIYETGVGTRNAAAQLAEHGFVTLAPDFFGYGESEPEPEDSWQARFEKPIVVIELIKTLQAQPLTIPVELADDQLETANLEITTQNLGIWAHSNGGQIALTVLEILHEPIPTTLWAPVTAPFPYSLLFFSDESEDEGKSMRKWISIFEKDYDVFDFSLTQHLDQLTGPLQLHHGTADEAALKAWSDEFMDKIKIENKRRLEKLKELVASGSAELANPPPELKSIDIEYFTYPGADHNLQPGWNTVVERDLLFFEKNLR